MDFYKQYEKHLVAFVIVFYWKGKNRTWESERPNAFAEFLFMPFIITRQIIKIVKMDNY